MAGTEKQDLEITGIFVFRVSCLLFLVSCFLSLVSCLFTTCHKINLETNFEVILQATINTKIF
jgi:hypothetical protein